LRGSKTAEGREKGIETMISVLPFDEEGGKKSADGRGG